MASKKKTDYDFWKRPKVDSDGGDGAEPGSDSDHLDRDPDDEQEPTDGPNGENSDEEFNAVENEDLVDKEEENDEDVLDDVDVTSDADENIEADEDETEINEDLDDEAVGKNVENKTCYMKNLDKYFLVMDEDDSTIYGKMEYVQISKELRQSDPVLTYYEMTRILGVRAKQFSLGTEPLVEGTEGLHPVKVAYIELKAKMTPFIIRRHLPGKEYEDWELNELEQIHEIDDEYFIPIGFDMSNIKSK